MYNSVKFDVKHEPSVPSAAEKASPPPGSKFCASIKDAAYLHQQQQQEEASNILGLIENSHPQFPSRCQIKQEDLWKWWWMGMKLAALAYLKAYTYGTFGSSQGAKLFNTGGMWRWCHRPDRDSTLPGWKGIFAGFSLTHTRAPEHPLGNIAACLLFKEQIWRGSVKFWPGCWLWTELGVFAFVLPLLVQRGIRYLLFQRGWIYDFRIKG